MLTEGKGLATFGLLTPGSQPSTWRDRGVPNALGERGVGCRGGRRLWSEDSDSKQAED